MDDRYLKAFCFLCCIVFVNPSIAARSAGKSHAVKTSSNASLKEQPSTVIYNDHRSIQHSLEHLLNRLQRVELLDFTDAESKLTSLLTSFNSIDSKLRSVHEKTQIWEILLHQVDALADHVTRIDRKIDTLRYEEYFRTIEDKLTNLEILGRGRAYDEDETRDSERRSLAKNSSKANRITKNAKAMESSTNEWQEFNNHDESLIMRSKETEPMVTDNEFQYKTDRRNRETPKIFKDIEDRLPRLELKETSMDENECDRRCQLSANSFRSISERLQVIDERLFQQHTMLNQINVELRKSSECSSSNGASNSSKVTYDRKKTVIEEKIPITEPPIESNKNTEGKKNESKEQGTTINNENSQAHTPIHCNRQEYSNAFGEDYHNHVILGNRPEIITRNVVEELCHVDTNGTQWIVIQRRGVDFQISNFVENFNRSWIDYKQGFGSLNGEFWYGNDMLHRLTQDDDIELRIWLEDWTGSKLILDYNLFRLESEEYNYNLIIGEPSNGTESLDSMAYHNNQNFSTYDRQNDRARADSSSGCCSCAVSYGGGWWYNNCIESNLNGIYQTTPTGHNSVGVIWESWLGDYSLKNVQMMIRSKLWVQEGNNGTEQAPPEDP